MNNMINILLNQKSRKIEIKDIFFFSLSSLSNKSIDIY